MPQRTGLPAKIWHLYSSQQDIHIHDPLFLVPISLPPVVRGKYVVFSSFNWEVLKKPWFW